MSEATMMHYRRVDFRLVEQGEMFIYKDGDPYVKIQVQRRKSLSTAQRADLKKRSKTYADENPTEMVDAALNLRTMATNIECGGSDLACVRTRGTVHVEGWAPLEGAT